MKEVMRGEEGLVCVSSSMYIEEWNTETLTRTLEQLYSSLFTPGRAEKRSMRNEKL